MNLFSKTLGATLAFFTFAAYAHGSLDERIESLEREMHEISSRTPQETLGVDFTTARPEVDGNKVFITFDILYWHPKVGGTEYAYSIKTESTITFISRLITLQSIDPEITGTVKSNEFNWEWGLKAGLGYNGPHDDWDLYAQYTWYQPTATSSSSKPPPSALFPLKSLLQFLAGKAKSFYDIEFQNVDVELGRSFFISKFLSFRPFLSVKATGLDLKQKAVYTASTLNTGVTIDGLDFKVKDYSRLTGVGPRIGFQSNWHLINGFSYFGDIDTAILYSHFETLHREYWPPSASSVFDPEEGRLFKIRRKFHRFIPYARLYTGLEWDGYVNDNHQHIRLKLGYEVQYYWRANQSYPPEDFVLTGSRTQRAIRTQFENTSEDVMFYGITGEFRLDF